MSAQHTPGPWVAHRDAHGLIVSAGSFCVARLGDGYAENATLIASAPELLAACIAYLADRKEAGCTADSAAVKAMRAAIAKATVGAA